MKKTNYQFLWKWHSLAGLFTLPVVLLLAVTGSVYLFKNNYEAEEINALKQVLPEGEKLSLNKQWDIASKSWEKKPTAFVLPDNEKEATVFVSGRFSHKSTLYVNPYTGGVNGKVNVNETEMHQVRKLHGELLLGKFGTLIVELVASWMVVLILTGVYLHWPKKNQWKKLFYINFKSSKKILFRDIHTFTGFWFSLLLLLILAGGLPWTDVYGTQFKWAQKQTNTGFPKEWNARFYKSKVTNKSPLLLEKVAHQAASLNLPGVVSVSLPNKTTGVYTIANQVNNPLETKIVHIDKFTGDIVYEGTWKDIGVLMKIRLWAMAFHQGQFGLWNLILVLFVSFALMILAVAALISFNKSGKKINVKNEKIYKKQPALIFLVVIIGVVLPMFGFSVLCIYLLQLIFKIIPISKKALSS